MLDIFYLTDCYDSSQQRSLRDVKGNILKRTELTKFLDPEYQIRLRVKSLHNGDSELVWQGPPFLEDMSPNFFIVQPRPENKATRHGKPNASIRLLFPR